MPRTPEDQALIDAIGEQIKDAPPVPPQRPTVPDPMQVVCRIGGWSAVVVGLITAALASQSPETLVTLPASGLLIFCGVAFVRSASRLFPDQHVESGG